MWFINIKSISKNVELKQNKICELINTAKLRIILNKIKVPNIRDDLYNYTLDLQFPLHIKNFKRLLM